MTRVIYILLAFALFLPLASFSQREGRSQEVIEAGETLKDYLKENHVEEIEEVVHAFLESSSFIEYLLKEGHGIDPGSVNLKKKDIGIGEDLDVYVKHFSEHQNFTMIMVPVDIYPLAIYDTLLFSVIEVSDNWLHENHFEEDLDNKEIKAKILSDENHHVLTNHMYDQVLASGSKDLTEVEIKLHESYISTETVLLDIKDMDKEERESMLKNWGLMKRILTHNVSLNIEINVYIFGRDDMQIVKYTRSGSESFRITPSNIFKRHHFLSE